MDQAKQSTTLRAANRELILSKGAFVSEWAGLAAVSGEGWGPLSAHALTVEANVEALGWSMGQELLMALSRQSLEAIAGFYNDIDAALREASGGHRVFEPLYPDFPRQVMEASDEELARNALAHYTGAWVGPVLMPEGRAKARAQERARQTTLRQLQAWTPEQAWEHAARLAQANASFSPADAKALEALWAAGAELGALDRLAGEAAKAQNKENLARLGAIARAHGRLEQISAAMGVATDALRLAAALSGGDASLAQPTRFKGLSRPERRALLAVVERHCAQGDAEQALENLFSRRGQWLRWAERVHPGELQKAFPLVAGLFKRLRENDAPVSFAARAQKLLDAKNGAGALELLAQRPGELIRRAAHVARVDPQSEQALLRAARAAASKTATSALVQARASFQEQAAGPRELRAFMPKGGMGRVFTMPQAEASSIGESAALGLADACESALLDRFSKMAPLGKVWIDPALKKVNVPFARRSASRATRSLARGSRLEAEGNVARLFVWWSEKGVDAQGKPTQSSRIDIDLSCLFLTEDFEPAGHVSWTMLRGGGVTHSGDITSAPNGACEFIDVDYDKLPAHIAYVAATVYSFTGQTFDEMPECFVGWQGREDAMAGELFDASAVQNKSDLAIASTAALPALIDVKRREVIWADLSLGASSAWRTVEGSSKTIAMSSRALALMRRPNLFDLFELHAKARGELVERKEDADRVFSMAEGTTPFDFETIASEFLGDAPPAPEAKAAPAAPAPRRAGPR
jgi:stress response protein SCP2